MIELKFILLQDFRMPSLGGGTVLQIGEAEPKNISFIGTSKNAVMTKIWIALCVYLLLAFNKFQSKLKEVYAANFSIIAAQPV